MKKIIFLRGTMIVIASLILTSCATKTAPVKFDSTTCMQNIPAHVKGLELLSGLRSKKSIINDMVSPVCNSRVLFRQMKDYNPSILPGKAIFQVRVEYTGEVAHVAVKESTIHSKDFLSKVKDFIMDTDFIYWAGDEDDTVFLYPIIYQKY